MLGGEAWEDAEESFLKCHRRFKKKGRREKKPAQGHEEQVDSPASVASG